MCKFILICQFKEHFRLTFQFLDKADSIVVSNIPDGINDGALELYLTNLTGVQCRNVQVKKTVAVVEMSDLIGKNNRLFQIL